MMPLATCVRCKKLFNKLQSPVCGPCEPDEEADYAKVQAAVDAEPGLSMEAAAERAGVGAAVVRRMLDRGLVASAAAQEAARCGKCGAPAISASKKLCQACLDEMNIEMARAQAEMKAKVAPKHTYGSSGMHSKDLIDRRDR